MPAVRSLGLILRTHEVFETSTVATVFTRELGKVSGLAKGARRLKSSMNGGLDLLGVSDIVLLHKGSDALDLIIEAAPSERFPALRTDLKALYSGCYVAELLNELTDFHDPHPRLFDASIVTLRHLGDPALRQLRVFRFELACLRELGLLPSMDECTHCGIGIEGAGDAFAFGLATGGILCAACRPGQPHVATISGQTLGALRSLASPGSAWKRLDLPSSVLGSIRSTLGAVISHNIGRRPRTLDFLGA